MASRTAKGAIADKTGALTLTLTAVALPAGESLLAVGMTYDTGEGAPVVTWGSETLEAIRTVSGGGAATRVWVLERMYGAGADTQDIVATWTTTAPTAKAMIAEMLTGVDLIDVDSAQYQAATSAPDSGAAVQTHSDDAAFLSFFGSEGPASDTVGTVGGGFTAGQRDGTNGAPPISNVTLQSAFKLVTAAESAQASKTGATSRDHNTVMVTTAGEIRAIALDVTGSLNLLPGLGFELAKIAERHGANKLIFVASGWTLGTDILEFDASEKLQPEFFDTWADVVTAYPTASHSYVLCESSKILNDRAESFTSLKGYTHPTGNTIYAFSLDRNAGLLTGTGTIAGSVWVGLKAKRFSGGLNRQVAVARVFRQRLDFD